MSKQSLFLDLIAAVHGADLGVPFHVSHDEASLVFPDPTGSFGDILMQDDGEEIIAVFGQFTHSHLYCYEEIDPAEKNARIVETAISKLRQVFSGEIVFYGSHAAGGGHGPRESSDSFFHAVENCDLVAWPSNKNHGE